MLRSRPRRASGWARAALGLAAALTLVALGHHAHADPPTRPPSLPPDWEWHRRDLRVVAGLELKYTVSPGATARRCEDESWFRQRMLLKLGYDPFKPTQPGQAIVAIALKRLEIAIELRWPTLIGTMDLFGAGGQVIDHWVIEQPATNCGYLTQDLASATYIAITLLTPPLPDLPAPPKRKPPAPPRAPAPPTLIESPRPLFRIGAAPLLTLEITPGLAAGVALDAAVRWPFVSLGLEGRLLFSTSPEAAGVEGADIDATFAAVTVVPCFHVRWYFGCGLFQLGALRFAGGGDVHPETLDPLVAAGGLRGGVEWPFTERFAVRGFVNVVGVFTTTALAYDRREIWTTPLVFGGMGVGVTAAF